MAITIELAQAINEDRKRVFGNYAFAPDMVSQVLRIRAELEQEVNADERKKRLTTAMARRTNKYFMR